MQAAPVVGKGEFPQERIVHFLNKFNSYIAPIIEKAVRKTQICIIIGKFSLGIEVIRFSLHHLAHLVQVKASLHYI